MEQFLAASKGDDLHPIWHVVCWAGLGRSGLAGLQWQDLDLDQGASSVRRPRTQVDGKPVVEGPKNASSRSSVDLDDQTVAELNQRKTLGTTKGFLVGLAGFEPTTS